MNVNNFIKRSWDFVSKYRLPIFLIWSLWLTLEYFGLGPFSYVRMHDWGDALFPMKMGSILEFSENGFSYWSSQAACGIDRLAATGPLFRVDSLFYFTFPGWLALGLIAFIQCFIAGYFTYRLCRDYLQLGELSSVVAGLAYSLSFFYFQEQFAGAAGFPLILWLLEYIHERKSPIKYIFACLLGVFVLFSSSFALSIPFVLLMALAWFVLVRRKYSLRFFYLFATFCAVLLAGEIPWILAALSQSDLSHRTDWTPILDASTLVQSLRLWSHSVFGYYTLKIMLAGLGLSILGVSASRFRGRGIIVIGALLGLLIIMSGFFSNTLIIWCLLGIALLATALMRPVERTLLMILLLLAFCMLAAALRIILLSIVDTDLLSGFQTDRFYLLAPFFAVLAGAYGLYLLRQLGIPRRWIFADDSPNEKKLNVSTILCIISICFLVVASLGIKFQHYRSWEHGARYATMYENPDLQQIALDADSSPFRVASIAHNIHPAYANAYGLETVDGYVGLYPQRYQDFWGKVIEPLTSKDEQQYNYFHGWGNRIYLFSPSNGDFNRIEDVPFSDYYDLDLLSLANARYIISDLPLSDEHLELLPSQIEKEDTGVRSLIDRIQLIRHLYIYENENCLPRFFLCGSVAIFDDSTQLLEAMADADVDSLRNTVFVEEKYVSNTTFEQIGLVQGEIVMERYSPDRIDLSVSLDKPGILVISNSYNPYWTCKVNGIDQDIFPAYHTFMGVFLSAGESIVELEYCPPYWSFY